jgi:tRNA-modifying protein YgfZ
MTSKPNPDPQPPPGWLPLPHQVLAIEGRDAADFLQRQTMNDVTALDTDGCWQWNGLLSAKGRVLALFALLRLAPTKFWLLLPDGDASGWAADLQRFVFRAKLQLQARAVCALGMIGEPPPLPRRPAGARALPEAGGWLLDHGSPGRPRWWWLGDQPPQDWIGERDPLPEAAWNLENIRHGLPRISAAQRDRHTPQMLGLERLAAFSVRKGCYPGQEIVARTHFLGQAKRRLQRLAAERALLEGERLRSPGNEAILVDHASHAGRHEGLAILPIVDAADHWSLDDGCGAALVEFIDGLARNTV